MSNKPKPRILLVDDEGLNIIALTQILQPQYEVLVAANGKTALEVAAKHNPDLILLDVIMPGMDGFEVLVKLKSDELTRDIPVIFITGLSTTKEEERGLLLGAVDYISKPFHPSIAIARINMHLRMAGYIRMIEQRCMIDTLTELTNRRGFDVRATAEWGRAIREEKPVGIIMLDIDKFKVYNDTYGHPQGDAALRTVGEILRNSLSRASDIAVRWGGEEFIALLPSTDLSGTLKIAELIRKTAEETVIPFKDGVNTSVTVSIGVNTIIPRAEDTIADFISAADKALYTAKHEGRNRICIAEGNAG